jgi:hypothetical protein
MTSVGFAIDIPIAPVVNAANILLLRGIIPTWFYPTYSFLTGSYNPILKLANTICLCKPAVSPFNKDPTPSSARITLIQFNIPVYLIAAPFYP